MKYIGERAEPPNMAYKWLCSCGKEVIEEIYEDDLWVIDYSRRKGEWY